MWKLSSDAATTVAFTLGSLEVRWYGLLYLLALGSIWWLANRSNRRHALFVPEAIEDLMVTGFLGAVVGGRIGYVLWYGMAFWYQDWLFPLKIWEGGMSFHGGLLGVLVAIVLTGRRYGLSVLKLSDFIAPLMPVGLFYGRIGNFINQELCGRATNLSWGVVFPLVDDQLRHPSQLYEALLEGVLLAVALNVGRRWLREDGQLTGAFLWGYGLLRIFCEMFREPDWQIGYLWYRFTLGELLSLPMIVLGSWLLWRGQLNREL